MGKYQRVWQFGLAVVGWLAMGEEGRSQSFIVPDDTLGAERSVVVSNFSGQPIEAIGGGARRGGNLLHSFSEFNVDAGRGAYFFSPSADIQNIFSRVTGVNPSNINGVLGTFGNSSPNLYLINPNGILFGPEARLDVGGSFAVTTANAIAFGDQGFFSATSPEAPSQLLTVNPSAFLFSRTPVGSIASRSTTPLFNNLSLFGLRVPNGRSITLLGGTVSIDGGGVGGGLVALSGNVHIGAVNEVGTVGLSPDGSLQLPDDLERADISFANTARIGVLSALPSGGGNLTITGRNIFMAGGSGLFAGTFPGVNIQGSRAGNILLDATNEVKAEQSSTINSDVIQNSIGEGGDIRVETEFLTLLSGSQVSAATFGRGNSGSVIVNAQARIFLDGISSDGIAPTAIGTSVTTGGFGEGGDLRISTNTLSLSNGAALVANTRGRGNAGDIFINARESISLEGTSTEGTFRTVILSRAESGAIGSGGNVRVSTNILSISGGARLNANTGGQGNAGNIFIEARDVLLDGTSRDSESSSSIQSRVEQGAVGQGGNVHVRTNKLTLTRGAQLLNDTEGQGNAGSVIINALDQVVFDGTSRDGQFRSGAFSRVGQEGIGHGGNIQITSGSLSLSNGAQVAANTLGRGDAGNLIINARDRISFDTGDAFSNVEEGGVGRGGNIQITTGSLSLTNGAQLVANTSGQGDAGSVILDARHGISFNGTSRDGQFASGIFSGVRTGGIGRGGNIQITSGSLSLANGAQLSASTSGQGDAGSVIINARDHIALDGTNTGVLSAVEQGAVGRGGDIRISTGSLSLTNGTQLITSTSGRGNAGSMIINARGRVALDGNTGVLSRVEQGGAGQGGNVQVTTGSLFLTNGAQLTASTLGRGNAGSLIVDARERIVLNGTTKDSSVASGFTSNVEQGGVGRGGNVQVTTGSLFLTNGAQLAASTRGQGNAGSVIINARDRIFISGTSRDGKISSGALSSVEGGVGQGGNIQIIANSLFLNENAFLSTGTLGRGNAGNILLNIGSTVELHKGSIIDSTVRPRGIGNGGSISINTRILSIFDGSQIGTSVLRRARDPQTNQPIPGGRGNGGNIQIVATDSLTLARTSRTGFSSGLFSSTDRGASGRAGNINLLTNNLLITDGAAISASTSNPGGVGGNISINARNIAILNGGQILTNARNIRNAGSIEINVQNSITISGLDLNFAERLERIRKFVAQSTDGVLITDIVSDEGALSGLFASTTLGSRGSGGTITLNAGNLSINDGAAISTRSLGSGRAGDIELNVSDRLQLTNSSLVTAAPNSSGGDISINFASPSGTTILRNGSITTQSGTDGGNIRIGGDGLIAFSGSRVEADADRNGGDITFPRLTTFIDGGYRPIGSNQNGTSPVEISATGSRPGTITVPDVSQVENSLTELQQVAIDPDRLIANSCIARTERGGTFLVTGSGAFRDRPGDLPRSSYPTGTVRPVPEEATPAPQSSRPWRLGDPIVEPQGAYRLSDGRIVMSQECSETAVVSRR